MFLASLWMKAFGFSNDVSMGDLYRSELKVIL